MQRELSHVLSQTQDKIITKRQILNALKTKQCLQLRSWKTREHNYYPPSSPYKHVSNHNGMSLIFVLSRSQLWMYTNSTSQHRMSCASASRVISGSWNLWQNGRMNNERCNYKQNFSGHYPSSCFHLRTHVSKTGFCLCLCLQIKPTQLGPIDGASPSPDTCTNPR
jgi:hypothetical protein